mgnify:CR=1 FL=1
MADNEKESEVVVEEAENKEPELPLEVVEAENSTDVTSFDYDTHLT